MATINELQDEVVEEFQDFSDWMDKYLHRPVSQEREPSRSYVTTTFW